VSKMEVEERVGAIHPSTRLWSGSGSFSTSPRVMQMRRRRLGWASGTKAEAAGLPAFHAQPIGLRRRLQP